ncbi:hypothetical protein F4814DRAFT_408647 [Daldinia grandis]|nr:hypothetical protein F4814DRAFT_408647 [Daldinia grandis]
MLYLSLEADKQQSSKDAIEILNVFSCLHSGHIYLDFLLNAALNYSIKGLEANAAEAGNGSWLKCFRKSVAARLSQYFDSVYLSAPSPLPLVLRNDKCLDKDEFGKELRVRLDRAMNVLLQRSLITITNREGRYYMHPLVHEWIRGRPSVSTAEHAYWCGTTAAILASNVSALHHEANDIIKDLDLERELLHHISDVDTYQEEINMRLEKNRLARKSFLLMLGIDLKRKDTGQAKLNLSRPGARLIETKSTAAMVSAPGSVYGKTESPVKDPLLFTLCKMIVFIFFWIFLWIGLWGSVDRFLIPLLPSYNKHLIKDITSIIFIVALIITVINKPKPGSNSNINLGKGYSEAWDLGKQRVNRQKELLTESLRRCWENNGHLTEELRSHKNEQDRATFTYPTILPHLLDSMLDRVSFLRPEPQLPPGQTRIRWTCGCGADLFDDFVEIEPGSLQVLQDSLQGALQKGTSGKVNPNTYILQDMRECVKRVFGSLRRALSTTHSSINNRTLPLHQTTSPNTPSSPLQSLDLLHVLFCIHTGETGLRLHQERLPGITSDRELLLFLRKEYSTYRKVTSWLTLRSVTRVSLARFMVDSSEFAEVHQHAHVCTLDCVCVPPVDRIGTEYNCRPAPEVKPKYVPPIGPRYLSHHFGHPDCIRPTQKFIYNQLPKRTCGQLQAPEDRVEFGWGVHFEEGWHWRSIYFVIVVLIASGSGVFGVTWSITKGDIQGGFAISSLWVTLGTLFLGYIAVRSF